jgi:Tol biopolymer transport system component
LFVSLLLVGASSASAQGFGRNKVNYNRLPWQTIRSEHFDLYFPDGALDMAQFTAEVAEDVLTRLQDNWNYRLQDRIPIILYTSHNTFSETNVIGELIGEGTGGFTEFNRNRVVIPYEGSYAQLRHVIHHELVHALQYDMFMSGSLRSLALTRLVSLPLWVVEGLAEFESVGWDIEADNILRDAVISDYVPRIEAMRGGVFAYKGGQSIYRYLSHTYDRGKVGEFLRSLKHTASVEKSLQAVYGLTMEELEGRWKAWLKRQYWPEIAERLSPSEFAKPLTEHAEGDGYLNVGGRLSPDGRRVAFVSTRRDFADVYLLDLGTSRAERIIEGEQSPDFESLFLLRPGLSWSPDGGRLAVIAKTRGKSAIFLYDVEERRVSRQIVLSEFDAAFTPAWSPSGSQIAFVALKNGWSDLYLLDLPSGQTTPLTSDPYDERDPDWSPDGTRLAFASDRPEDGLAYDNRGPLRYGQYDIFVMDTAAQSLSRVTHHEARDLYPAWGPDGASLLFVSERSGIGNIYGLDLATRTAVPITDSLTGCQQLDLSLDGSRLVFSAFHEGGYDLFLIEKPLDGAASVQAVAETELARDVFTARPGTGGEATTAPTPPQGPRPPSETSAPAAPAAPATLPASIPKDLAALGVREVDVPAPESAPAAADTASAEGGSEESDEEAPASRRRFTRPRRYQPRLSVESFGLSTQVTTFLGFSGQAYLTMSDLLGNTRLVIVTDQSISSIKNVNAIVSYAHLRGRLDRAVTAFHTRDFFLANEGQTRNRVVLVADRTLGVMAAAEYPLSQFARFEGAVGAQRIERDRVGIRIYEYDRVGAFGDIVRQVEEQRIDQKAMVPVELAYVQDTVGYGIFGPVDGRRLRLSVVATPRLSPGYLEFVTGALDYRHYIRLDEGQSIALRFSAGHSRGRNAQKFFLGGVATEISPRISSAVDAELRADEIFFPSFEGPLRGADLYEFVGDTFGLSNAEWRFELLRRLSLGWPLAVTFRHVGGTLFADVGAAFDARATTKPAQSAKRRAGEGGLASDQIVAGLGFGGRMNLGIFILRLDVAWRTNLRETARSPRYYWSIGADF